MKLNWDYTGDAWNYLHGNYGVTIYEDDDFSWEIIEYNANGDFVRFAAKGFGYRFIWAESSIIEVLSELPTSNEATNA